jgi:hypothetical protein
MAQTLSARVFAADRHDRVLHTDLDIRTLQTERPCGHKRHFGPCPACQRAQLARWDVQLDQVSVEGQDR